MATNGYRTGPVTEDARTSEPTLVDETKKGEKYDDGSAPVAYTQSDDPFGDESNAEVKYKVLAWW